MGAEELVLHLGMVHGVLLKSRSKKAKGDKLTKEGDGTDGEHKNNKKQRTEPSCE